MPTSATSTTQSMRSPKMRQICFTDHGVDEPEFDSGLSYLACVLETCPSTIKMHWQGFPYHKTGMKLTGWKKLFPGANIEMIAGDFAPNHTYSSKEGQLIEHGQHPHQGEHTDLQELKVQLDEDKRPLEIANEVDGMFGVVVRTHKFAEKYWQYKRQHRLENERFTPQDIVRYGPTGTGKTSWMDQTFGTNDWCRVPGKGVRWFDHCDCDVVLFDDVKVNEIPPIGTILDLTDRYPLEVEVKGEFITWKSRVIVFTSNFHPYQLCLT